MSDHVSQASPSEHTAGEPMWLTQAKAGNAAACRMLVRRHQRRVLGTVRAIVGPAGRGSLAEDLAQETFLRAFRALPRFDGRRNAKISTWLCTIATRVALNEPRRRRPPTIALDTIAEALPSSQSQAHPMADAVHRAIAGLSPTYRGAFVLRELCGLDYAEVAEELQIDLGTVKSRLSRARANLRRALQRAQNAADNRVADKTSLRTNTSRVGNHQGSEP